MMDTYLLERNNLSRGGLSQTFLLVGHLWTPIPSILLILQVSFLPRAPVFSRETPDIQGGSGHVSSRPDILD